MKGKKGMLGDRILGRDEKGEYWVFKQSQILYAFYIGEAGPPEVSALRAGPVAPRRGVHIRTRSGVFLTNHRSLISLRTALNLVQLVPVNQSVVVNLDQIVKIDPINRKVGVAVSSGELEWLRISRRYYRFLQR